MTERLQTLLHEHADSVDLAVPDLTTITREGRARARRRRGVAALGSVAALALVGVGVGVLVDGPGSNRDQVASDPIPTNAVSWASGDTLHVGDSSYDLGHSVLAYVRTTAGYVFADGGGAVWSVRDGAVERVGATSPSNTHLVADADGSLAGWVDPTGAKPVFVVIDQANGKVSRFDDHTEPGMKLQDDQHNAAYLYALDGRTAYWHDTRGVVATDVDSGTARSVSDPDHADILAVRGGLQAVTTESGTVLRHTDGSDLALVDAYGGTAVFSSDGAWVSVDADNPHVYRTDTGARTTLDLDAWFATGYEWLDAHTLVLTVLRTKHSDYSLVTCTVPDGACQVAVPDLGSGNDKAQAPGFELPTGYTLG